MIGAFWSISILLQDVAPTFYFVRLIRKLYSAFKTPSIQPAEDNIMENNDFHGLVSSPLIPFTRRRCYSEPLERRKTPDVIESPVSLYPYKQTYKPLKHSDIPRST